jgi:hypothetical protein
MEQGPDCRPLSAGRKGFFTELLNERTSPHPLVTGESEAQRLAGQLFLQLANQSRKAKISVPNMPNVSLGFLDKKGCFPLQGSYNLGIFSGGGQIT